MSYEVTIQEKTLVNGVDVSNMSDNQLFGVIADAEKEIARLNKIENKPQKLEARVTFLKEQIAGVVTIVDNRDAQ